ncbi:MAG: vanadium-dependent haloperoxidase [Sinimarinibacterium sp.]|jgi:hypothetical protein
MNASIACRFFLAAIQVLLAVLLGACSDGDPAVDPDAGKSIARIWNEQTLDAIRIDLPRPPVHARNLWHVSAAMYDAWAAYEPVADGIFFDGFHAATDVVASRREAISHAAYRVLKNRYALSANAATSLAAFDAKMRALGYDPDSSVVTGDSPAAVGARAALAVIAFGDADGARQASNYDDPSYAPANSELIVAFPGIAPDGMDDPNRWQPLALQVAFSQNGIPLPSGVQRYVGSHWGAVTPFAIERADPALPYFDPGPPPMLGGEGDAQFKANVLEVIRLGSGLTPDDGRTLDISPGAFGNNPLGSDTGSGRPLNPATGLPYAPQPVKRGDFGRVLAEFWADGPRSETPPGHWNVIANGVSDDSRTAHRFQGVGPELDRLEWDVKLYAAINAAAHDAAVACWTAKRYYDYVRPISMIRYMAGLGQASDPADSATYSPSGLPLESDLVERITADTWPNGRHMGVRCCKDDAGRPVPCTDDNGVPAASDQCVGEIAVLAWPGQPADPRAGYSGTRWIWAEAWQPYQASTFVTPPFAAYTSGHSTYSRAAAEVLADFTGSEYFPGGLGEFTAPRNGYLSFELGPSEDVRLQWATYYDAADQAGQSRLWGGIHVRADDYNGRIMGAAVGAAVKAKIVGYFDGSARP